MPNIPIVSIETPVSAGTETGKQSALVQKSSVSRKEPLAFKKKLEDCIKVDETPYGVPTAVAGQTGSTAQENSMAANLTDTQENPQIVGILEGFGLLDYQSDLLVSSQGGQAADEQTAGQAADTLLQGLSQTAEQTGALEKYARMLSKDQLSKLPPELQQAIAKAVGDYLGSFESTNNESAQEASSKEAGIAPVNIQAAEASADIAALPDKIASLLIKLKSLEQDARPAEAAPDTAGIEASGEKPQTEPMTAKTATAEPASKAEKAMPETAKPAVLSAGQPVTDKSAESHESSEALAVKPEAKTSPASEQAAQTQRTDAPVNLQPVSAGQTDADGVQQTAKAQQTTGSNFVKDNVMRIVDKMSTQVSDGKYDFDVELKPDFLGKVNIKLSMENGEIRMQIKTDDIGVKSMFADQISSMQAVLKDKGIAVTNIDVTYQSQMQTGQDQRSYSQNGSGKKQSGRAPISLEQITGTGVFETMSQMTGYAHGGSSVEYLA